MNTNYKNIEKSTSLDVVKLDTLILPLEPAKEIKELNRPYDVIIHDNIIHSNKPTLEVNENIVNAIKSANDTVNKMRQKSISPKKYQETLASSTNDSQCNSKIDATTIKREIIPIDDETKKSQSKLSSIDKAFIKLSFGLDKIKNKIQTVKNNAKAAYNEKHLNSQSVTVLNSESNNTKVLHKEYEIFENKQSAFEKLKTNTVGKLSQVKDKLVEYKEQRDIKHDLEEAFNVPSTSDKLKCKVNDTLDKAKIKINEVKDDLSNKLNHENETIIEGNKINIDMTNKDTIVQQFISDGKIMNVHIHPVKTVERESIQHNKVEEIEKLPLTREHNISKIPTTQAYFITENTVEKNNILNRQNSFSSVSSEESIAPYKENNKNFINFDKVDNKEQEILLYKREINNLKQSNSNNICFDCASPEVKWVNLILGVFLCFDCAKKHMDEFNISGSFIKSLEANEFTTKEYAIIRAGGNDALKTYLNGYGIPNSTNQLRKKYLYKAITYYIKNLRYLAKGKTYSKPKPLHGDGLIEITLKDLQNALSRMQRIKDKTKKMLNIKGKEEKIAEAKMNIENNQELMNEAFIGITQ